MTVFTIGVLDLRSRSQTQKTWMLREDGVLQFMLEPAGLQIKSAHRNGLLVRALKAALPHMAEARGQGERDVDVDQLFRIWRPHFQPGGDPQGGVEFIQSLMAQTYLFYLEREVEATVKVLSADIPRQWRLTLTLDPATAVKGSMEWVLDFEARYRAQQTKIVKPRG